MPDTIDMSHYGVVDRPSATAEPAPLTPDQLDHVAWLATSAGAIAIVEKPVLAALLAAYRRDAELAEASHGDASAQAGLASPRPLGRPSCELRSRVAASGDTAGGPDNQIGLVIIDERGAAGEATENATADDPAAADHLDRALTKLYRIEDIYRIGDLYFRLVEEAADQLELAGYSRLAADLREGGPVRRVTDAVREALRIGEGEK